jgi:hypothetical protein
MAQLDNKNLDLNPNYQRGNVWKDKMRTDFIESVYKGIIPQNITLNKEFVGETTKLTCIDGKQRLTTLKMFQKNEIPLIIYLDDDKGNEKLKYIYFNSIPKYNDKYSGIEFDTLKNMNQIMTHFLDRKIPVGYYSEISYADQTDIFKRINKSEPATKCEIYSSNFQNEYVGELLNNCLKNNNFLQCDRGQHVDYIIKFLQMVVYDKIKISNRDEQKFIIKYDNLEKMTNLINKCNPFLQLFYSDKIIKNSKIKYKSLLKNFLISISYMVYKKFNNYENNKDIIINLINKIWNTWNATSNRYRTCSTDKSIDQLYKLFDSVYNEIIKIDSESESEHDTCSDSDSESPDETYTKNKLKQNKSIQNKLKQNKSIQNKSK